jgi:formate-dependent nitrite reductase membrane component NrfD
MYMSADRPDNGGNAGTRQQLPARVAYDVPRPRAWGWKVSSYIWTKSLATGGGLLAAFAHIAGAGGGDAFDRWVAPGLALVALAAAGVLLVADLKRPERFWTILVRPQWRSWLARGAFVITAYGALLGVWLAFTAAGNGNALEALAWPLAILATLTAIYTAFLFAQCEGRDLWQSPRLTAHLALHAVVAGFAAEFIALPLLTARRIADEHYLIAAAALIALVVFGVADAFGRHATANAAAAAHELTRGRQAPLFWGALLGGTALPAFLLLALGPIAAVPAGLLALAGLWLHAHALVLAGQGPPIS